MLIIKLAGGWQHPLGGHYLGYMEVCSVSQVLSVKATAGLQTGQEFGVLG